MVATGRSGGCGESAELQAEPWAATRSADLAPESGAPLTGAPVGEEQIPPRVGRDAAVDAAGAHLRREGGELTLRLGEQGGGVGGGVGVGQTGEVLGSTGDDLAAVEIPREVLEHERNVGGGVGDAPGADRRP